VHRYFIGLTQFSVENNGLKVVMCFKYVSCTSEESFIRRLHYSLITDYRIMSYESVAFIRQCSCMTQANVNILH
jgi:hypothetical protein